MTEHKRPDQTIDNDSNIYYTDERSALQIYWQVILDGDKAMLTDIIEMNIAVQRFPGIVTDTGN